MDWRPKTQDMSAQTSFDDGASNGIWAKVRTLGRKQSQKKHQKNSNKKPPAFLHLCLSKEMNGEPTGTTPAHQEQQNTEQNGRHMIAQDPNEEFPASPQVFIPYDDYSSVNEVQATTQSLVKKVRALESLYAYKTALNDTGSMEHLDDDDPLAGSQQLLGFSPSKSLGGVDEDMEEDSNDPFQLLKQVVHLAIEKHGQMKQQLANLSQSASSTLGISPCSSSEQQVQEIQELKDKIHDLESAKNELISKLAHAKSNQRTDASTETLPFENLEYLIADLETQKKALQDELSELIKEKQDLEQASLSQSTLLDEQDQEIRLLRKLNSTLQSQIQLAFERTDESREEMQTQLRQVENQLEQDEMDIQDIEVEHAQEVGALLKIVTSLREQIEVAFKSRAEMDKQMVELRKEYSNQLLKASETLDIVEAQKLELLAESQFLKSINTLLQEQIKVSFASRDQLDTDFHKLEKECQNTFSESSLALDTKLQENSEEIINLRAALGTLSAEKEGLQKDLNVTSMALEEQRRILTNLESDLHTNVSYPSETADRLEASLKDAQSALEEKARLLDEQSQAVKTMSEQIQTKDQELARLLGVEAQYQDLSVLLERKEKICEEQSEALQSLVGQMKMKEQEFCRLTEVEGQLSSALETLTQELKSKDEALQRLPQIDEQSNLLEEKESILAENTALIESMRQQLQVKDQEISRLSGIESKFQENATFMDEKQTSFDERLQLYEHRQQELESELKATNELKSQLQSQVEEQLRLLSEKGSADEEIMRISKTLKTDFEDQLRAKDSENEIIRKELLETISSLKEEVQLKDQHYLSNIKSMEENSQNQNEAMSMEISKKESKIESLEAEVEALAARHAKEKSSLDQTVLHLSLQVEELNNSFEKAREEMEMLKASAKLYVESEQMIKELEQKVSSLEYSLQESQVKLEIMLTEVESKDLQAKEDQKVMLDEIEQLQVELAKSKAELQDYESDIKKALEESKQENTDLLTRIEDLIKEKDDLETKWEKSKSLHRDSVQVTDHIQFQLNQISIENAQLKEKEGKVSQELILIKKENEKQILEIERLDSELKTVVKQSESLAHELQTTKLQLADVSAQVITKDFEISSLNQEKDKLKSEMDAEMEKLKRMKIKMEEESRDTQGAVSELQSQNDQLLRKMTELDGASKQLKTHLSIREQEMEDLRACFNKLEADYNTQGEKIKEAEQTKTGIEKELSKLKKDFNKAEKERKEATQIKVDLVAQNRSLSDSVQEKDILLNQVREQLQNSARQCQQLNQELDTLRESQSEHVNLETEHKDTIKKLKSDLDSSVARLKTIEENLVAVTNEKERLETELAEKRKMFEEAQSSVSSMQSEISRLTNASQEVQTLRDMTAAIKHESSSLRSDIQRLQTEKDSLTRKIKELETKLDEAKMMGLELEDFAKRGKELEVLLSDTRKENEELSKILLKERNDRRALENAQSKPPADPSSQSAGPMKRVLENSNVSNTNTPLTKRSRNTGTPSGSALKQRLTKAIEKLPDAAILSGMTDDYDGRTTHIISPASSRTLKTFAAALKGAWIITDPMWILKSAEQGKWIPETPYGSQFLKNAFQGKRYYVAPSFEDVPQSQQFRIRYMRYLINECVLNAKFVESPEEADVIFRGDQDKTSYGKLPHLDWARFVGKIPQPNPKA